MPVAQRFKNPHRVLVPDPATREKTAPEERWWFPLGSITRVGEGAFRWHCVGTWPETGKPFIFSGRLDLQDGVGVLLAEDMDEGDVDEDPMEAWLEKLWPFPYCHVFYDQAMEVDDSELGPWFCKHCHYGKTQALVDLACENDPDRVEWNEE